MSYTDKRQDTDKYRLFKFAISDFIGFQKFRSIFTSIHGLCQEEICASPDFAVQIFDLALEFWWT